MIFAAFAVFWLWLSVPGVHWLDGTELALAACSLGIGHPPGQVPHAATAFSASFLPVGDCAFRVTLVSIAGCVLGVFGLHRFSAGIVPKEGAAGPIRWERALLWLLVTSAPWVLQATRPEVYGLSAGLFGAALWFSSRGDSRSVRSAAFLAGFLLANHPVIGLAALPFVARRSAGWPGLLLFALAGFSVVYLPVRAGSAPPWNFGNPADGSNLVWFLSARMYRAYETTGWAVAWGNLQSIAEMSFRALTPIGCLAAVAGGIALAQKRREWFSRIAGSMVLSVLPLAWMSNFSAGNPDVAGYLLPFFGLLWVSMVEGVRWVSGRFPGRRAVPVVLTAALLAVPVLRMREFVRRSPDWSAPLQMRLLAAEPPASARVDTASFETFSFLRYAQIICGLRPDLDVVYRGLGPGFSNPDRGTPRRDLARELGVTRNAAGRYTLRREDRELAGVLSTTGWFFSAGGILPMPLRDYTERLDSVIREIPEEFPFGREPLIWNELGHILFSRSRRDMLSGHELERHLSSAHPAFDGIEELEVNP